MGMKEGGEGGGIGLNSGSGSVALRPLAFRPGLAQRINTPPPPSLPEAPTRRKGVREIEREKETERLSPGHGERQI